MAAITGIRVPNPSHLFSPFSFFLSFFPENGNVYFHSGRGEGGGGRVMYPAFMERKIKKRVIFINNFLEIIFSTCSINKYASAIGFWELYATF